MQPARIGLAAASRPADVLPLIGWDGAANRWENAVVIAAVLRSWEERFRARLLRVGFAEIQLLADRPPRTLQAAQHLAAEQFAFCDECAGQGLRDVSSITSHLLRSPQLDLLVGLAESTRHSTAPTTPPAASPVPR